MKINSVELKNIRSYDHEKVEFPEGTVLLSGDIGSGKSSILLAIEFAIFGIKRGSLPGTALLRHGEKHGWVKLNFTLEHKDVTIYRSLERTKDSVTQDNGYITIDGKKFEGTPTELKAKIIDMLGYPKELVTKSKSLIYRYTVYTPQEAMKQILMEGDDQRLDTLRKIFNIDKYKRIKENAALLARDLRSDKKIYKKRIEDLDDTKEKLDNKKTELKQNKEDLEDIKDDIDKIEEKVENAKEKVEEIEKQNQRRNKAEKQYELAKNNLDNKKEKLETNQEQQEKLKQQIKQIKKELEDKGIEKLDKIEKQIEQKEKQIQQLEDKISQVKQKEAKRKTQKEQAKEIKQKITNMDECPVCKQKVTQEHKQDVKKEQKEKIKDINQRLQKAKVAKKKISDKIDTQKENLEKLRKKEKELASIKEKQKRLEEKQENFTELEKEQENIQDAISDLKESIDEWKNQLEETEDLSDKLEKAKERHKKLRNKINDKKMEKTRLETEIKNLNENIEDLEESVEEMKQSKEKLDKIKETLEWIDEYFVKVMDVMEKQVMLRIYNEFNEYFIEWFNTLMEDESVNVRLDEQFAPVIVQDGYETTIENLSGGERTSVALAYRLSLNKVINDFVGTIKTKNLIILDEPTDGFSNDQLDKVRDVLQQLDINQVIVVSHEAKMETYVDNIIEIAKQNNKSRIV